MENKMKEVKKNFKKGAASFYVVAFSTLILAIIATSFATAIIAEITRTSNDDLSQSAYDAALAGVEDAKLALLNYDECLANGRTYADNLTGGENVECQDIVYWVNHPEEAGCDMVARILGRIGKGDEGEVLVEETVEGNSSMDEAYTCTTINTKVNDYRASLSSSNSFRVINVHLEGVDNKDIKKVRINWYSNQDEAINLVNTEKIFDGVEVMLAFKPLSVEDTVTPPMISVQMVQTAENFKLGDLNSSVSGNNTDRATLYLVPDIDNDFDDINNVNKITADKVADTNNTAKKNDPFSIKCNPNSGREFMCSADIELPSPIGGVRSNETFTFVVSIPYGQPDTDFAMEFFCGEGDACGNTIEGGASETTEVAAQLKNMQVEIDSTGRANDLFRRVVMRLDSINSSSYNFNSSIYAMQLFGTGEATINKDITVTTP